MKRNMDLIVELLQAIEDEQVILTRNYLLVSNKNTNINVNVNVNVYIYVYSNVEGNGRLQSPLLCYNISRQSR